MVANQEDLMSLRLELLDLDSPKRRPATDASEYDRWKSFFRRRRIKRGDRLRRFLMGVLLKISFLCIILSLHYFFAGSTANLDPLILSPHQLPLELADRALGYFDYTISLSAELWVAVSILLLVGFIILPWGWISKPFSGIFNSRRQLLAIVGTLYPYLLLFFSLWFCLGVVKTGYFDLPYYQKLYFDKMDHIERSPVSLPLASGIPGLDDKRKFIREVRGAVLNPFLIGSFVGILTILINASIRKIELLNQKKLHDILFYFDNLEDHRVLCGYGRVGQDTLKDLVKELPLGVTTATLIWDEDEKVTLTPRLVVVEKDETKVPYILGNHPVTGKVGYVQVPLGGKKYTVPVLVADIKSLPVQELLALDLAQTITSSIVEFESNLAIVDRLVDADKSGISEQQVMPGIVIPCQFHQEREILEQKVARPERVRFELLQINEHIGFTLADLVEIKVAGRQGHPDSTKLLICGSFNLYHILEGLILNRTLRITRPLEKKVEILKNIVVYDPNIPEDNFDRITSWKEVSEFFNIDNVDSRFSNFISSYFNKGSVGLWRLTLCLAAPHLVKEHAYKAVVVPVLRDDPYQFLIKFIEHWRPDLLLLLYQAKGECLRTLKLIEWYYRWHKKDEFHDFEVVVSTTDQAMRLSVINILEQDFNIPYGAYAPFVSIARELALLENMVRAMSISVRK